MRNRNGHLIKLFILLFGLFIFSNANSQTVSELETETISFLNTLGKEQLNIIQFEFNDSLRTKWTNLPIGLATRPGLEYGDLSAESKIQFHHILTTFLSSQGYLKTTSIMKLDDILNEVYETAYKNKKISDDLMAELRDLQWDFSHYFISVWGKPGSENPWGLKFEGHHISLNLSAVGNNYSLTPLFFGTDPAEVHTTKYAGLRVLSKEEDYGFRLINSLTNDQQKLAIISSDVPKDITTNPNRKQMIIKYSGIKASHLSTEQKVYLKYIIEEYVNNLEHEKAHEYMHKFKNSGIDNIWFGWIGSFEPQKPHYYVINGPDFLIEYDNMGFQNSGNHIHSIWREKGNDFGEDILKTHYLQHKH